MWIADGEHDLLAATKHLQYNNNSNNNSAETQKFFKFTSTDTGMKFQIERWKLGILLSWKHSVLPYLRYNNTNN